MKYSNSKSLIGASVFSALLLIPAAAQAQSLPEDRPRLCRYDRRVERAKSRWDNIFPNLVVAQYAGNIGLCSLGLGWDYGKHDRWETHALLGYLPKNVMDRGMVTFTLRETLNPWQVNMGQYVSWSPAVFGFSLNTVFNNEFWLTESEKYPGDYYRFSSKLRAQLSLGGRVNLHFTHDKKQMADRLSFYYEFSTYDLAIISYVPNMGYLNFTDIWALGFGLEYKLF